jgi:hypothetical protein
LLIYSQSRNVSGHILPNQTATQKSKWLLIKEKTKNGSVPGYTTPTQCPQPVGSATDTFAGDATVTAVNTEITSNSSGKLQIVAFFTQIYSSGSKIYRNID